MAKDKFNPEEWLNQPTDSNKAVIPGSTGDPTPTVMPDPDRASNDIETITQRIEARCLDITAGYDNWRDLGFALSEELGEIGRDYYHRISRFNPDYDQAETDKQYDRCLHAQRHGRNAGKRREPQQKRAPRSPPERVSASLQHHQQHQLQLLEQH